MVMSSSVFVPARLLSEWLFHLFSRKPGNFCALLQGKLCIFSSSCISVCGYSGAVYVSSTLVNVGKDGRCN